MMYAGSVSRTFDDSFRVTSQTVNGGSTVSFSYDDDDLLTGAGAMTLSRDVPTGLLAGTVIGAIADAYGYATVGEVTSYAATVSGSPLHSASYTRDDLGRIAQKTETVAGVTDIYTSTTPTP